MDWLLSEEFVSFSQKIAEIYAEKKKVKQEVKEFYDKSQGKLKELESKASSLQDDFESWKKSQPDDQAKPARK